MRLNILILIAACSVFACKNAPSLTNVEQKKQMEEYFTKNNIGNPQITNDGLMYVITQVGSGTSPSKGDKVTINYKGKLLNGKEFDSTYLPDSGPLTYTVGKTVPGLKETVMIAGFDEAVLLLKQGGSGTFVIPPARGYGSKKVKKPDGSTLIEPNSVLIFDIQLIEVKKEEPAK